jgi:hypothetical protein
MRATVQRLLRPGPDFKRNRDPSDSITKTLTLSLRKRHYRLLGTVVKGFSAVAAPGCGQPRPQGGFAADAPIEKSWQRTTLSDSGRHLKKFSE